MTAAPGAACADVPPDDHPDPAAADLMSIGEFASQTRLTPKMLRVYGRRGLLRPAYVDDRSSYRYYVRGQLHTARLIRLMREFGMSLAQIEATLADPQAQEPQRHLARLERAAASGRLLLDEITAGLAREAATLGVVHVVYLPETAVVSVMRRVGVYGLGDFVRDSAAALSARLPERAVAGDVFVLLHDADLRSETISAEVCLPVDRDACALPTLTLPATQAVMVDAGPRGSDFPRVVAAHRSAIAQVRRIGGRRHGPPRQRYTSEGRVHVLCPFSSAGG